MKDHPIIYNPYMAPWVQLNSFGEETDQGMLIGPSKQHPVCSMTGYYGFEQVRANARLIAAAPELLDALESVLKDITFDGDKWSEGSSIALAKKDIAKATKR